MMTTSEKATQKSMTCPHLSVHQRSFLWALLHEFVLSTTHRIPALSGAGSPFLEITPTRLRRSRISLVTLES
jgi:7,8-dihydro-6-hydroxymethylpterin-pyrophosphokinase